MISIHDLQARNLPIMLDGNQFLTNRTQTVTSGVVQYIYQGFAYPGSAENAPAWMIQRTTVAADGSTATLFADGQAVFNQVWTDRANLNYL
ncbi:MAG: hypothetical protein HQL80_02530 [Magnetococcales bacterium]|nr:hypothetical protein [Magnetococcales bacterium]MBF0583095.1 hypothetical protein [Magnetococcales bacterium]